MSVFVSVSGSMTGGAAGFKFGRDRVPGQFIGRIVVEFEQICGLAIDALMIMGLENHPFLTSGWVTSMVDS